MRKAKREELEAADSSVSVDLLLKVLLSMGASRSELARIISRRSRRAV